MIKKLNQNMRLNKNETEVENENKSNNSTVWFAYYANRKAITLIALVITIIVLLILVGVTINLVLGPEGLLKQAQDATDKYKQAENEEINSMSNLLAQLETINNGNGGETEIPTEPEEPPKEEWSNKYEENTQYTDTDGKTAWIPKGFQVSTKEGENKVSEGLVIRNADDLNEFVWIPTDLVTYKTYDWNKGYAATEFKEEYDANSSTKNTQIINEITNSVKDYNGYYISRYEAGLTTKRTRCSETKMEDYPVPIFRATSVSTPVYGYNYIGSSASNYVANNLYNKADNNVTSRLINSRGWDTALKFIETVGKDRDESFPINSIDKGWHEDNHLDNVDYETGKSVDLTNETTPNKLKNIYDLSGNLIEWSADVEISRITNHVLRRRMG